ncbi:MAG: transglutaminase domain-containing protein [Lachnospiraceae bacterium]|nr:transglutaminase domain-containing protein [Lachnospiraceae bacterium]
MKLKQNIKFLIIRYVPDAIMNFLLLTGTLCGFLSAFEISYDLPIVLLVFSLLSVIFAIECHFKSFYRIVFYLILFILFVSNVMKYGSYLNAGFYTIVNTVVDDMSTYLNTSNYQEYKIVVTSVSKATTLFTLFIGVFFIILINTAAAEKKNIFASLLFTLPLLCIPFYIHQEPSIIWQVFLISGYLLVLSGKYMQKQDRNYERKKLMRWKFCFSLLVILCLLLCIIILNLIFPSSVYQKQHKENQFKTATYENMSTFLMFGLSGFFNDYSAVGGMSGGQLGGINSIRPDYMTDLIVEFVPYRDETLYLKGFTGISYEGRKWLSVDELESYHYLKYEYDDAYHTLKAAYENGEKYSSKAQLRIKNVGASTDYDYLPYYTSTDDFSQETEQSSDSDYTSYTFYPYQEQTSFYTLYPDSIYKEIPEENKKIIRKICKEEKIGNGDTEQTIAEIQDYFSENFTYSMSPGKTPGKEDFVNYFLTKSRKGYCSHFASAAVLMLRYCGIPARYVEGYALSSTDMEDGTLQMDKKYEDYYDGYNELGESGVLRCEINDSQAHAWVEYFDEDFGWRVAEFTPPSSEGETSASSLWDTLSRMLNSRSVTNISLNTTNSENSTSAKETLEQSALTITFVIKIMVSACLLFIIIIFLIRRWKKYYSSHHVQNLLNIYCDICRKSRKKIPGFHQYHSHKEQLDAIENHFSRFCNLTGSEKEELACKLEQISYGNQTYRQQLSKKDYKQTKKLLLRLKQMVWLHNAEKERE